MADNKRETADALYQVATIGLVFPVAIALGFFLGRWLDGKLGTWPWLTGILTAFGIIAAFVNLFRTGTKSDAGIETTDSGAAGGSGGAGAAGGADRDPRNRA
jgi:F0F1-type ATP synthase assembly protein I